MLYGRRYGDKAPRSICGRLWGVVWILVGVNLMSFLFTLMASALGAELDASSGIRGIKVNSWPTAYISNSQAALHKMFAKFPLHKYFQPL